MKKIHLEKIKERVPKKYNISKVFYNSELESEVIRYLKKQDYLNYDGIIDILSIKFNETYPFGYVLKCNDEIVGFLGTIFSHRKINSKNYICCNLHTWIVDKSHRLNSYLLLLPIIEKEYLIMTFTPIKSLIGLYEKFAFKKLEMKYRIIFSFDFFDSFKKNFISIERDSDQIKKKLKEDDWKIYQDHASPFFIKFMVFDVNNQSDFTLIICTKVKKKVFNVFNILYSSNNLFLKKNWCSISRKIHKEFKINFFGEYFLDEKYCVIPSNIILSKDLTRNICVKNLPSDMKFDILYSEII